MFESYKFAVMAFACYCRMNGREEPAMEAERERERLSKAMGKSKFLGGHLEPVKNEEPFIPGKIVECAIRAADPAMKSRREEVSAALTCVTFLRERSREKGILSLEEAVADIKMQNAPFAGLLSEQIMLMIDLPHVELMTEIMANEFLVKQPDDFEALIRYIYMLALIMVRLESRHLSVWFREEAWKELVRLRDKYIRFLPAACKKAFQPL